MTAWYNENDPYAAQWLRNLIAAGHIAPGVVDERSIKEVEAFELMEFTQCHFFAGIGIWSGALREAGWPDDRKIWTGSCPCQPFSAAGKQKGFEDERHLWPVWFDLIAQCRPDVVVGEQVASKDGLGWFDTVSADLERTGYACGANDLCAAGFQEAHIRQRLYFVALGNPHNPGPQRSFGSGTISQEWEDEDRLGRFSGNAGGLANCESERRNGIQNSSGQKRRIGPQNGSSVNGLEHVDLSSQHEGAPGREQSLRNERNFCNSRRLVLYQGQTYIDDRWFDCDWLLCRNPAGEPSWRPVESGTFPLAHGVASRMGKLRAYGNALDFRTAQEFCETIREIVDGI